MIKNIKHFISILILILSIASSFAQETVVKLKDIALIAYDTDLNYSLYQKISANRFKRIAIDFDINYKTKIITHKIAKDEDDHETLEAILSDYDSITYIKDLRAITVNDLYNTNWSFPNPKKDNTAASVLNIESFKNGVSNFQELYYGESQPNQGFGIHVKQAKQKQWHVNNSKWFYTFILDLGNNKHIAFLGDAKYIYHILLPLKNSNLIVADDYGIIPIKNTNHKDVNVKYSEAFNRFYPDEFYKLKQVDNKKYQLINQFEKRVLNKVADTIIYNRFFIEMINNKNSTIYNHKLEPLPLQTIRKAYLQPTGLEVLTNAGVSYYDFNFNKMKTLPSYVYSVCGTVHSISHKINTTKSKTSPYSITITSGGLAAPFDIIEELTLNTSKGYTVSFLDDSDYTYTDDNNLEARDISSYLKVKKNKKYGIYTYSYEKEESNFISDEILETRKDVHLPTKPAKVKELLPIRFDAIEYNNQDGQILFYKNNKVGIFPRDKTVVYDELKKDSQSFYSFTKNCKKGWLDIKTYTEYYLD